MQAEGVGGAGKGEANVQEEQQRGGKRSNVRSFPNGFIMEDVAMGQPDGKLAKAGKRVRVKYTGRLAKNGKVFDSSDSKGFTFRLGAFALASSPSL